MEKGNIPNKKNSNCMSSVVAIANSGAGMVVGKPGSGFVWRTLPSVSGTHKEAQGDLLEAEQELLPGSRLTFVTTSPPHRLLVDIYSNLSITGAQRIDTSLLFQIFGNQICVWGEILNDCVNDCVFFLTLHSDTFLPVRNPFVPEYPSKL